MNEFFDAKQELMLDQLGDTESVRLVMAVLATARKIDAMCAHVLGDYGLSEGRMAVLLACHSEVEVTPRQLAQRIGVTTATVTGLLDRLQRDGLIIREPHSDDRRAVIVRNTEAGTQLVKKLLPRYSTWLTGVAAGISDEDIDITVRVLGAIHANLQVGARPDGSA